MKFLLGLESLEGTVAEQRVIEVLQMGTTANHIYKPRSGKINNNLHHYNPEQLEYLRNASEDMIHFFGYAQDDDPKNTTPFFDY